MRRRLAAALAIALAARAAHALPDGKPRLHSIWRHPEKAILIFQQALRVEPTDADAATNLATAYARLKKWRYAEQWFREAIRLAPSRYKAYASLAELLANAPGRFQGADEALALFRTGLAQVAADPVGYIDLSINVANFERAIGRTGDARARLAALDETRLSPEQRKRVLDLGEAIRGEERARALLDQPAPPEDAVTRAALDRAEVQLARGEATSALATIEPVARAHPAWPGPRWLSARAHEQLGRYDDAERELTVLLQLQPSRAEAWRRLGVILADHGGALETERAAEALRQALALEPRWWDLWLARARVALRGGHPDDAERALDRYLREAPERAAAPEVKRLLAAIRMEATSPQGPAPRRADPPTEKALALYNDARAWQALGDPDAQAAQLVTAALDESPGFVDAAVLAYALLGHVSERTARALAGDRDALLDLARKVRAIGRDAKARAAARPWIERAVELGSAEARLERAILALEDQRFPDAEADLLAYIASGPRPPALDEARLLLARLHPAPADSADAVRTRVRIELLADRAEAALDLLGDRCDAQTPADRLASIALVHEWQGRDLARAVACYREALRRAPDARTPLVRLAGIGARAALPLVADLAPELRRAADLHVAPAEWAIARLALSRGDRDDAFAHAERFLAAAGPDDPERTAAIDLRERIAFEREQARRQQKLRTTLVAGAGLLLLALVLARILRRVTLARAIARRPALYPDVNRAVAELRHDVLKHRTSVLGLLVTGAADREEVARVLLEPEPTSKIVKDKFARLREAARRHDVTLVPLGAEPVLGPLVRDLRRAESIVAAARPDLTKLGAIDARLREVHSEHLGALLRAGPRTRVDAPLMAAWIRAVEAELRAASAPWIPPVLLLAGMELDFPVEAEALATVFSNLLRNAQAAASARTPAGAPPSVLVRAGEERDAMGRRRMLLVVGDSSPEELTLDVIEARPPDRGLGIVREIVRQWRGQIVLGREDAPHRKSVGASFPVHS